MVWKTNNNDQFVQDFKHQNNLKLIQINLLKEFVPYAQEVENNFEETFNYLRQVWFIEHGYLVCAEKYDAIDGHVDIRKIGKLQER